MTINRSSSRFSRLIFPAVICITILTTSINLVFSTNHNENNFSADSTADISINQLGYLPSAYKAGMAAVAGEEQQDWELIHTDTGQVVCSGQTTTGRFDADANQIVVQADFSACQTPGTYTLHIGGISSPEFVIASEIYAQPAIDAMRYFYLSRSGITLEPQYASDWARNAGHLSDNDMTCRGCDYTLNASRGWYDAGDYGKYVVTGGISIWTLLNLYEQLPAAFADDSLNIPESGNGVPDILDEVRWELEFLLGMQVPQGYPQAGMVHHLVQTIENGRIPSLPPEWYDNDNAFTQPDRGRYLSHPTTIATYHLAASGAHCARVWQDIDAVFAARCLDAAQIAFTAAREEPVILAQQITYRDDSFEDEMFHAAAELYITTGDAQYLEVMTETAQYLRNFTGHGSNSPVSWRVTSTAGVLSLLSHDVALPDDSRARLENRLLRVAEVYRNRMFVSEYRVSLQTYDWGSNSEILNNAIFFAYAHQLTDDVDYLNAMIESLDYLLGRNALRYSFISGYGDYGLSNPHHSFWANEERFPPPPPGVVTGGPNNFLDDPTAIENIPANAGAAQRYIDLSGSWSTNEVAINYNAPLVWVLSYVHDATQP